MPMCRILEVSDERMADGVHFKPPEELHGVFWFSVFTSFFLAFTIGANDVANNFGTSVGSGAVSMRTAIYIAGFAEVRCGCFPWFCRPGHHGLGGLMATGDLLSLSVALSPSLPHTDFPSLSWGKYS